MDAKQTQVLMRAADPDFSPAGPYHVDRIGMPDDLGEWKPEPEPDPGFATRWVFELTAEGRKIAERLLSIYKAGDEAFETYARAVPIRCPPSVFRDLTLDERIEVVEKMRRGSTPLGRFTVEELIEYRDLSQQITDLDVECRDLEQVIRNARENLDLAEVERADAKAKLAAYGLQIERAAIEREQR